MEHHEEVRHMVSLPFGLLPEGRFWSVGNVYRVKLVLKQTGISENDASFEILDASSMSNIDRARHELLKGSTYNE